jgi:hypothetical protein
MTDDRRSDRIIRSWFLAEAPERAPDHLRAAVRSALAATPQDGRMAIFERRARVAVPPWTIAAVVLVALGITAVGLFGGRGPAATPSPPPVTSPSPSPSPSPKPSVSIEPTPAGIALAAGPTSTTRFQPTFGFVAPDGWIKLDDRPLAWHISPTTAGFFRQTDGAVYFDGIYAYARPLAGPPDGGLTPVEGVGTRARDLAEWLAKRPQLTVTTPKPLTFAGRPAWQLDFSLSSEAGELCGIPCANLLNSPDRNGSYAMGIEGRWAVHATFVDAPDGTTVLVTVEDVDGSGLASEVSAAQPILDSIAFR